MTKHLPLNKQTLFKNDSGSIEAQITFLTHRVIHLDSHLRIHNKDHSSRRGLRKILGKRKRFFNYLVRKDAGRYEKIMKKLGI